MTKELTYMKKITTLKGVLEHELALYDIGTDMDNIIALIDSWVAAVIGEDDKQLKPNIFSEEDEIRNGLRAEQRIRAGWEKV